MSSKMSLASLSKLREIMKSQSIDAFYISGNDPHLSETAASFFNIKPFLSGFTGSAGEILITPDKAFLFTDGRYFLQAKKQLFPHFTLMGEDPSCSSVTSWLIKNLNNKTLGFESLSTSLSFITGLEKIFEELNDSFKIKSFSQEIWSEIDVKRDPQEFFPIRKFPDMGVEPSLKVERIREEMKKYKTSSHIISALEDIAWILNMRGEDFPSTEVFYSFLVVEESNIRLFINKDSFSKDLLSLISSYRIEIDSYNNFFPFLKNLEGRVWVDASRTSYFVKDSLSPKANLFFKMNPSSLMKMQKNPLEIIGFENSHLQEGIVWVEFYMWLNSLGDSRESLTEMDVIHKLRELRSQRPSFIRESFSPIVGWADHGAIIHYNVTVESNQALKGTGSLLLVDAGGHYAEGTTDMTRTFALGEITQAMKEDYTRVLKGLIRVSLLSFPEGTFGEHIDILAREALWSQGLNYNHGTGHGVGSCLNVHEGPCCISRRATGIPLTQGVVLSNEPGLYREGHYGIRLENLIWVDANKELADNLFYNFRALSLCPFEAKLIDKTLLSQEELKWLSDYHNFVYDKLNTHVGEKEKSFLAKNKDYFSQLIEGEVLDSILAEFSS